MNTKEQYCKYSLIAIILILGVILFTKFTPFLTGILGALTIYLMVRKQMIYLTEKKHFKQGLAAALMIGEAILCFLVPISLVVWLLINKLQNLNLDTHAYITSIKHIADLIQEKTGYNVLNSDNLSTITSSLPALGRFLVGNITNFSINIFIMLFVLFFMLIDRKKMETYIYELLPFSKVNKKNVIAEINMIVKSNAIGIPLLAVVQGVVSMIGYFIFGVPNPFLFGFLSCFATIIPIIGVALLWVPLVIYLFLVGNWGFGIGLIVYSIIITSHVDNLGRFILQKKLANTHPLITIFGVFIGLSLFGFMGIIFGPLILSIFLLCVNIFKLEYLEGKK